MPPPLYIEWFQHEKTQMANNNRRGPETYGRALLLVLSMSGQSDNTDCPCINHEYQPRMIQPHKYAVYGQTWPCRNNFLVSGFLPDCGITVLAAKFSLEREPHPRVRGRLALGPNSMSTLYGRGSQTYSGPIPPVNPS